MADPRCYALMADTISMVTNNYKPLADLQPSAFIITYYTNMTQLYFSKARSDVIPVKFPLSTVPFTAVI